MKKTMFAMLAGLLAMGAARAQTATDNAPHAYVGLGVGVADDTVADGHKVNAKLFGGYEFNRNWGIEAGLTRFRTAEFTALDWTPDGGYDIAQGRVKTASAYLAGKYAIPINERFSAYGKLGVFHSESKVSAPLAGWNYKSHTTGLYGGLGAQYRLTQNLAAVAEYERFGKRKDSGAKANVYSVGLKYAF